MIAGKTDGKFSNADQSRECGKTVLEGAKLLCGAIKVFCHNIIKNGHACLYQVASIFSIEETTSCPILRNNFNNILTRRGKKKRTTVARNYIHAFATENFYILFYKTI